MSTASFASEHIPDHVLERFSRCTSFSEIGDEWAFMLDTTVWICAITGYEPGSSLLHSETRLISQTIAVLDAVRNADADADGVSRRTYARYIQKSSFKS